MSVGQSTSGARISTLTIDQDLDMEGFDLKSDDLKESTADAGVTIDELPVRDGVIAQYSNLKAASDNLRHSHDAVGADFTTSSYVKIKTYTFTDGFKGIIRTKFALWSNSGVNDAYGAIYKNGTLIGTPQHHSDSGTYNTYSEDIDFGSLAAGDTIELWGKVVTVNTGRVKEFRLYYDNDPEVVNVSNS